MAGRDFIPPIDTFGVQRYNFSFFTFHSSHEIRIFVAYKHKEQKDEETDCRTLCYHVVSFMRQ